MSMDDRMPTHDVFADAVYEGSPQGWWTEYGGALDVRSGVVSLPGPYHPPCLRGCERCRPHSDNQGHTAHR